MPPLNLPPFNMQLQGDATHPRIFDVLRKKYVALTPEEWVRQHFVHFLIEHQGYPATLMDNEVSLQMGDKHLRADSVLYNRQLQPLMIIEYKAPSVKITQKVFEQISGYNLLLRVPYLIISNGLQHFCMKLNPDTQSFTLLKAIPAYSEL